MKKNIYKEIIMKTNRKTRVAMLITAALIVLLFSGCAFGGLAASRIDRQGLFLSVIELETRLSYGKIPVEAHGDFLQWELRQTRCHGILIVHGI